jgi:peptidoglycan/LPS O-acetylase OafA/YrhL
MTECSKYWAWHLFFLNNIVPWDKHDTCMSWTWYLANDMQFYILVPFLVRLYYKNRNYFYYAIVIAVFICKMIQIVIIIMNSLSISYFTYSDEYWTIYYVKPYSRLPVYLVGVLAGCSYYSFKREDPEGQRIAKVLEAIKYSKLRGLVSAILGVVIMQLMVVFMQLINNAPNNGNQEVNLLYLVFARPMFIIGFSMFFLPILVGSAIVAPFRRFLSHSFWIPFSRLSFGAYLSHGIFMLFREFNTERGHWACAFDCFYSTLAI